MGNNGRKWIDSYIVNKVNEGIEYKLNDVVTLGDNIFTSYLIKNKFNVNIKKAIELFQKGKPIIIMDDGSRENEGDLVLPAEKITPEITTFFIRNTTGILCVSMEEYLAHKLKLPKILNNEDVNKTPFAISCDFKDCKTGVSSIERSLTIKKISDDNSSFEDFTRPGHIFPLISSKGGLYERRGHTEASVEFCKIADVKPIAVLAELVNENGTMMDYSDCCKFADKYGLIVVTIDEIKNYLDSKLKNIIRPLASCFIELKDDLGQWELICYSSDDSNNPHKVLIKGDIFNTSQPVLTRVHSECFTGDVLGSLMCDCGEQFIKSLHMINEKGSGIIIIPANHEGRGIGLVNKVKAYKKMKNSNYKINTYHANLLLNYPEDCRKYNCVLNILDDLKINEIDLLTENPFKIQALKNKIRNVIPIKCAANKFNEHYLKTKEDMHTSIFKNMNKIDKVNNIMNNIKFSN